MTYAKGDLVRIVGGSSKWIGLVFTVESDGRDSARCGTLLNWEYGPWLVAGPRPDGLTGDFRWPREQLAKVQP